MKTEEKTTKRFWRRGNVLDIAILLLLVAILAAVGYRYYQTVRATEDDALSSVRLTYTVKGALPVLTEEIRADETLYLDGTNEVLGLVVTHMQAPLGSPFSATPAQSVVQDAQGHYVTVVAPDGARLDLTGVLICRGTIDEDGSFLLDGRMPLTPGQTIAVHTERTAFVLTVSDIEKTN